MIPRKDISEIAKLRSRISRNAKPAALSGKTQDMHDETVFQQIFNKMPDAVIILDRRGVLLEANEMTEKMSGYSRSELLGRNILTGLGLLDTKTKILCLKKLALHFSRRELSPFGIEIHRKDGGTLPLEINPQIIDYRGSKADLVVLRDITERKNAEEYVRKSEERFRQVAENADEFIWEVDASGLYTYASPAVKRILGYAPEEIVGKKHFYDFFVPDVRENLKKGAFGAFAKKETFRNFVNPNVHKDGRIVIIETSGSPVLNGEGKLVGYRGLDVDMTESKRFEDEMKRLNQELKSKIEEMEKFNKIAVGRELKMIELKKRIKELEGKNENKK